MKHKPYVGITGPVNKKEVRIVCDTFSDNGYSLNSGHVPMIGFLVSSKTLNGEGTKNLKYPPVAALRELTEEAGGIFTTIHYNTKETETLANQISRVFGTGDIYDDNLCRAVQLNIPWPPLEHLNEIKKTFEDIEVIFQISESMLIKNNPVNLAVGVSGYSNCIDHVLIDPSGGKGAEFDSISSSAIYHEIKNKCPELQAGFAGGITGDNVARKVGDVYEIIGKHDFSIDAEGGLRSKITPAYGDDLLHIGKVKRYIKEASRVLK